MFERFYPPLEPPLLFINEGLLELKQNVCVCVCALENGRVTLPHVVNVGVASTEAIVIEERKKEVAAHTHKHIFCISDMLGGISL